jgi:hypothetical protein
MTEEDSSAEGDDRTVTKKVRILSPAKLYLSPSSEQMAAALDVFAQELQQTATKIRDGNRHEIYRVQIELVDKCSDSRTLVMHDCNGGNGC